MTAILFDGFQEFRLSYGVHRIGRDRRMVELAFDDELLSRLHACLVGHPGQRWLILDLRSSNGTMVNGVPVRYRALEELDAIELGATRLVFREELGADDGDGPWTRELDQDRLAPALSPELFDDHLRRARRTTFDRVVAVQSAGRLAMRLAGSRDLPRELSRRACELVDGDGAWLLSRDPGEEAWVPASRHAAAESLDGLPGTIRQLADLAAEGTRTLLTAGPDRDPWLRRDGPHGVPLGPALAAPLHLGGHLRGVLVVSRATAAELFEEDDRIMLERYAGFAAAAWAVRGVS